MGGGLKGRHGGRGAGTDEGRTSLNSLTGGLRRTWRGRQENIEPQRCFEKGRRGQEIETTRKLSEVNISRDISLGIKWVK